MKSTYIPAIVFFILTGLSVPAHAADDLAKRDWSTNANPSLEKNPPVPEDIRAFVNHILNAEIVNPIVCSSQFLDAAHDGTYRLVATLDSSGRHYCNEMVVIGKKDSGFNVLNQWRVWHVDDIKSVLRDISHDGHEELVIPQNWTPYEGAAHCLATWQGIYQWENGKFADHSSLFPDFYKARLTELKAALDKNMGYGPDAVCQQMEIDKINRFLMIEPRAGFIRAEEWMKGNDTSLRRKAAAVFADIGDSDSRTDLETLSKDPESLVAETAKMYMNGSH